MSEKQASSEIAQSRERFLKSVGMIERLYRQRVKQHGDLARLDNLLEEWFDQAEWDTRERLGSLHASIIGWLKEATRDAEKCVNPGMRLHGYGGAKVLIEELERIRGKE